MSKKKARPANWAGLSLTLPPKVSKKAEDKIFGSLPSLFK